MARVFQQKIGSVCLLLASLMVFEVNALTLHYDDQRSESLVSCDEMAQRGEHDEARACFEGLLEDNSTLTGAEAARALGDVRLANRLFRETADADENAYVLARWGQLFLSTHQVSDAAALFRESLILEPGNIAATVGLAEAQGRQFQGEARQSLYEALQTYPQSLHAMVLLARIELELQKLEQAEGLLNAALDLAMSQGQPPLEIYALYASLDLLRGNANSVWTKKALELNPRYGDIYAIPSHFYIITYRYREAVDLYQKAIDIEPELADARSKLGINLLRTNDVFGARYHLEKAYEIDPYNTETVNTLRLLDDLDSMRVSHADVYDEDGQTIGRILLKLNQESAGALEPYALSLSEEAVQVLTKRYDFQLKKPVTVELYHNHDDFGVRTVSTPGVGLLGVTFGYLLAMDSPKARAKGDFHWGSTLWHELVHVFTLEAANHLLPRWYSEGLSVYEEWHTGPLDNRELPLKVLEMLDADRFLPLADLDSGFVRPTYDGQVNVSYMQAGLVCTYIADRWGHEALVNILKSFAQGVKTKAAILQHLGIETEEFDSDFKGTVKQKYAYTLANLDELKSQPQQISRAIELKDWKQVEELSRRRIEIYPDYVSAGNGYNVLARALREQGQDQEADNIQLRWKRRGGYDPVVLTTLAKQLSQSDRSADSMEVLEALNWVNPYQPEEHRLLGEHYLLDNKPELAIREFDALIGSTGDDTSTAWLGKGRAYHLLGQKESARRSVLQALEKAPYYREAQKLLLELNPGESLD